jgi:rod shape-determining protein MreD
VSREQHGYWVVLGTFLIAYVLATMPFPAWLHRARPEWLALVLIYWAIALPHRVGVYTGALLGIGLDVLEGVVLGQNALSLTVLSLISLFLYQRLRVFNLWQQCATVFIMIGINQILCQWVLALQGLGDRSLWFLLPAFTSALFWPVILHLLRGLRRAYQVN